MRWREEDGTRIEWEWECARGHWTKVGAGSTGIQDSNMAAATSVVVLDRGNNTTCTINLHGTCARVTLPRFFLFRGILTEIFPPPKLDLRISLQKNTKIGHLFFCALYSLVAFAADKILSFPFECVRWEKNTRIGARPVAAWKFSTWIKSAESNRVYVSSSSFWKVNYKFFLMGNFFLVLIKICLLQRIPNLEVLVFLFFIFWNRYFFIFFFIAKYSL